MPEMEAIPKHAPSHLPIRGQLPVGSPPGVASVALKKLILPLALFVLVATLSNCGSSPQVDPVASLFYEKTARALLSALIEQRCDDVENLVAPSRRGTARQECGVGGGGYLSGQIDEVAVRYISSGRAEVVLTGKFVHAGTAGERDRFTVEFRQYSGKWYVYGFR